MAKSQVLGLSQLNKNLRKLPKKLQNSVLRAATRSAAAYLQKKAKGEAPRGHGTATGKVTKKGKIKRTHLYKDIKVKTRRARGTWLNYTVHAGATAYYARWVEFGTKPHKISSKKGLRFGGIVRKTVNHPGISANPFMKRTLDRNWREAAKQFKITAGKKLNKMKFKV